MAIPRLAERVGVTPRVLRYWEEQRLISPTREHGKLRYSPRDLAIAALIRRLLDAGVGVEGIRMLKRLAERDVRRAAATGEETRSPRRRCASCTSARPSARKPAPTRSTTPAQTAAPAAATPAARAATPSPARAQAPVRGVLAAHAGNTPRPRRDRRPGARRSPGCPSSAPHRGDGHVPAAGPGLARQNTRACWWRPSDPIGRKGSLGLVP